MEDLEIFLSSEQPTACPKCGNRTEIIDDFDSSQEHKCLSEECNFQFILEFDSEDGI
ncbi:hypothetical protein [Nubsella zeaxanthinifaciens]|uniref:hypothetical protein n=1 Tax=Nubsella zeaxanthinifaciens TaxID=392412 RepID=UPI001300A53F|nr:hypothetical protein [Nubsella zeaxanthinifaciens]